MENYPILSGEDLESYLERLIKMLQDKRNEGR